MTRRKISLLSSVALAVSAVAVTSAEAAGPSTALGGGGAVASVDHDATKTGLNVLRSGGNAVDAAVATGAALGVTEPYSAGIGGGGYMVIWDARRKRAITIDGRETAPKSLGADGFIDPTTGKPRDFDSLVTSGLSVGVPGTPALWERATRAYGKRSLARNLEPAARLADRGFTVDATFQGQTKINQERFARFPATTALYLPGGALPVIGSRLKNRDLAKTYREVGRLGTEHGFYSGRIGTDIVRTVRTPPTNPGDVVYPSGMSTSDLLGYRTRVRSALATGFRGTTVYGMPPSSGGGIAVAEILNIIETLGAPADNRAQRLHRFLQASRLAFADRNRWVGDDTYVSVPTQKLISRDFAATRACLIEPLSSLGEQNGGAIDRPDCGTAAPLGGTSGREIGATTHLVTSDRWGNMVSYTLTIEQTGGSGITVPGRGFLLNNELTDFDAAPPPGVSPEASPNLPAPGKRPRSSMSPTIIVKDGKPWLAIGSPGGATIITTVSQTILNRIDENMGLPHAIAAPRASQRNRAKTEAEPDFISAPELPYLEQIGEVFTLAPAAFTPDPEIGAVAAIERMPHGGWLAAAEPRRRGGGSAGVTGSVRRR